MDTNPQQPDSQKQTMTLSEALRRVYKAADDVIKELDIDPSHREQLVSVFMSLLAKRFVILSPEEKGSDIQ